LKYKNWLLLLFVSLSLPISAQCGNNTVSDYFCQTATYFQVGPLTNAKDACDQIRDALGTLNPTTVPSSTFGGVVNAIGMVPYGGTPAAMTCLDNRTSPTLGGDNPFYNNLAPTPGFVFSSHLLLGAQTLALNRQWVIPTKSSIVGLSGTSGYNSASPITSSNTVLVACNGSTTPTYSPACLVSSTPSPFVPQLMHCTFSYNPSSPPALIHCTSAHGLYPGNFVLIEGTGTNVDDAWEVTALPTGAPTTDFNINYSSASSLSLSGLVVNIPLIWLGSNVGISPYADEGVSLESIAVDCNDLPNSIGIFSATVNENSFLNHVSVRHCTRNGVFYKRTQRYGAPADFGPDGDVVVYMSDGTPTSAPLPVTQTSFITTYQLRVRVSSLPTWDGYPVIFSNYPGAPSLNGLYTVIGHGSDMTGPYIIIAVPPSTATCPATCGTVNVAPAGYRVELGGQPWRGLNGATIRPNTTLGSNTALDGVQLDGVVGGTIQNIHCEILNDCIHATNGAPGYGTTIQNISSGVSSAGLNGTVYVNDPQAGTNIFAAGLVNPGSNLNLIQDQITGVNNRIKTSSVPFYSPSALQSCGVATITGSTPNPYPFPCIYSQGKACLASPIPGSATPALTLPLDITTFGTVGIYFSGTGQLAISCFYP
jgi:hypothetical protein